MRGPSGTTVNDVGVEGTSKRQDEEFDPSIEMMINDFDDERTIEEEEALETTQDPQEELSVLQREGDMPLEELLAMYNYGDPSRQNDNISDDSEMSDQEAVNIEPILETESSNMEVDNPENGDEYSAEYEPPSELHELYFKYESSTDDDDNDEADGAPSQNNHVGFHITSFHSDEKNAIFVGSEYQAVVPDSLSKYDDALPYENEDKLLWDPYTIPEKEVENYLVQVKMLNTFADDSVPQYVRDDEQALYLLLQCGFNIEEAVRRRKMNIPSTTNTMALWSEDECRNFEAGFKRYSKNFREIHQHKVRTRSIAELVQFYYLWKKSERCDMFMNKHKFEKADKQKKAHRVDHMDKIFEELEVGPLCRDHSTSPNVKSLIYGDPKRQRIHGPGAIDVAIASTSSAHCSASTSSTHCSASTSSAHCSASTSSAHCSPSTSSAHCSPSTSSAHCSPSTSSANCSPSTSSAHCSASTSSAHYSASTSSANYFPSTSSAHCSASTSSVYGATSTSVDAATSTLSKHTNAVSVSPAHANVASTSSSHAADSLCEIETSLNEREVPMNVSSETSVEMAVSSTTVSVSSTQIPNDNKIFKTTSLVQ